MLLATILVFAFLLWVAWLAGRNLLFPPALFAAVWLISLIGLFIFGDVYFPIPDRAYLVYIVGGIAFAVGGIVTAYLDPGRPEYTPSDVGRRSARFSQWALDGLLVLLILGLPLYWRQLTASVDIDEARTMLQDLRASQIQTEQSGPFNPVLNLAILAQCTAMAVMYEMNDQLGRRLRAILAAALALVYGGIGATKLSGLNVVVTLAIVSSLKARRLKLSTAALAVVMALGIFSLGLLTINLAREAMGGTRDIVDNVAGWIRSYWLSGLVAFGPIALNPAAIPSTQPIDRFFWDTAYSLGARVNPPPRFADYTDVSTGEVTNIYTIYFSYFKDYGWIGTIVLMFVVSAILTWLYHRALRGKPIAMVLYAHLAFVGIVMSIVAEGFFNGLNQVTKLLIFLAVIYGLLPAIEARRAASPPGVGHRIRWLTRGV